MISYQSRISMDIEATYGRIMLLTHELPTPMSQTISIPTDQQLRSRATTTILYREQQVARMWRLRGAPRTFLRSLRHAGVLWVHAELRRKHLMQVAQNICGHVRVANLRNIIAEYACD
jgi:hypothetical protein